MKSTACALINLSCCPKYDGVALHDLANPGTQRLKNMISGGKSISAREEVFTIVVIRTVESVIGMNDLNRHPVGFSPEEI